MILKLDEWLNRISQFQPKEQDFGLHRVKEVAGRLKLLPLSYKAIIVGGTNGKGTTCHLLEHIYRHAGYKTGLHTSPHLLQFNERIVVNGRMASDESICEAFSTIEQVRGDIQLSYFEFALLATLLIFRDAKLDIAILEVGLGGRLDAVNIIDADVVAITTIDFDHTQWLGNSREQIGYEKAGIFRIGKPAVIGDPNVPLSVLQYAEKLNVPLFVQGKDFFAQNHQREWGWRSQFRHFEHLALPAIPLQNAASALMITECLNQTLAVQRADIDYGLSQVFVPGRFQIIQKHCPVILDVAHNAQSARLLAENLQRQAFKGKTYAVFSALADKDLHGIVEPLAKFIDCWCYSDMQTPRAATKQQLKECLNPYPHQYYANLKQAYSAAFEMATAEDRVIVFGSFYVVASILPILL